VVQEVGVCFVCLRSNHETSNCPRNPWSRCGILGCYGGHHHLLHPEVGETMTPDWNQRPEAAESFVEDVPTADDMAGEVLPEGLRLSGELDRLTERMDQLERASKMRTDVLENENKGLRKELREALESRNCLELEIRGLRDRLGFLESTLLKQQLESALLAQQKASAEIVPVGCLRSDPGSPRDVSRTEGHPVRSAAEEDTSDDELLAEFEDLGEEPRGQEVWWGGILEPLGEMPLEPEPAEIMNDLIQFEEDLASTPDDVFGTLEVKDRRAEELSLLLEEFTTERDWEFSKEELLSPPDCELRAEKLHPSCGEILAPEKVEPFVEGSVAARDGLGSPTPCPTHGWGLIGDDQNTDRVLRRLAYIRRFVNSCWGRFRPLSRELSTVEIDLAKGHLDELRRQEGFQRGDSSVGWKDDFLL